MEENRILIPVDFTESAKKAFDYAIFIALKDNMKITFLHVVDGKTDLDIENRLSSFIEKIIQDQIVKCDYIIREGNIFTEIQSEASKLAYKLMIIVSQGYKGIREKLIGTDILKLVKSLAIPVIVIQKDHTISEKGIKTILFPIGSHKNFINKINGTAFLAKIFNSEIHIYTLQKEGIEWSNELKSNIEQSMKIFDQNNISYKQIIEESTTYSIGYSKQILLYAKKVEADLISIMSNRTNEFYYIADSDKEAILTNQFNIPVLCANEK